MPVGAGGAADTLARNLSNGFSQFANGQPLVVENRPGAGGTIAAAAVAREKPDGYTLFLTEVGPNAVSHTLTAKLPYDPHTAFTPIIHAANLPAVVLIRPTLPYTTLADFVSAAKQRPGKFNYASAGLGNWTHLFMAYLNSLAGIDQVNVIYRSGAEMLTALLRNEAAQDSKSPSPWVGIKLVGKGNRDVVGSTVVVETAGFSVVLSLVGHGVGRSYHEDPQIPNYGPPGRGPLLQEGMTLAIEPMITAGEPDVYVHADEWSISSVDESLAAHFEHTVAITAEGPRVLTVAKAALLR